MRRYSGHVVKCTVPREVEWGVKNRVDIIKGGDVRLYSD